MVQQQSHVLSKSDSGATTHILAPNIGTGASILLTYRLLSVRSIHLIPVSERASLCLKPGVIAADCLLEIGSIE